MWIFSQLFSIINCQFRKYERCSHFLEKNEQPEMVTIKMMILRDKLKANVYTFGMPKNYGVVYNKHIVMDDYTTLPYGF